LYEEQKAEKLLLHSFLSIIFNSCHKLPYFCNSLRGPFIISNTTLFITLLNTVQQSQLLVALKYKQDT